MTIETSSVGSRHVEDDTSAPSVWSANPSVSAQNAGRKLSHKLHPYCWPILPFTSVQNEGSIPLIPEHS